MHPRNLGRHRKGPLDGPGKPTAAPTHGPPMVRLHTVLEDIQKNNYKYTSSGYAFSRGSARLSTSKLAISCSGGRLGTRFPNWLASAMGGVNCCQSPQEREKPYAPLPICLSRAVQEAISSSSRISKELFQLIFLFPRSTMEQSLQSQEAIGQFLHWPGQFLLLSDD